MFIESVTADGGIKMNSVECSWPVLPAHIHPNAATLIGQLFTVRMANDPEHIAEASKDLLEAKNRIFYSRQVNHLISA